MLKWKPLTAIAAAALLAATVARADDATMAIVVDAAMAAPAPGKAGDVPTGHAEYRLEPLAGRVTILDQSHIVSKDRGEYWLGVFVSRASAALQAQLKLPKDQGLLVEALQPASPAAMAGIQQYDIVLKGNDKPLSDLDDLIKLINQVKEGKLTLDLLRAGKHETVIVTPAKRPANEPGEMGGMWLPKSEAAERGLYQNLDPNFMGGQPMEFHIVHPGQILPPGGPLTVIPGGEPTTMEIVVRATSKLVDGSKVEITRHGAEPAKVVVTHDKEKWEGTSGDLSKIPEKLRPEVEKLLHPAFDHLRVMATSGEPAGGNMVYFRGATVPPGLPGQFKVQPDVEKRLSELQKQVDELRRTVEALQSKAQR